MDGHGSHWSIKEMDVAMHALAFVPLLVKRVLPGTWHPNSRLSALLCAAHHSRAQMIRLVVHRSIEARVGEKATVRLVTGYNSVKALGAGSRSYGAHGPWRSYL